MKGMLTTVRGIGIPPTKNISKEFELHSHMGKHTVIPQAAQQACLGGVHTPLNPHRQRLLVAAQKPAKLKAKAAAKHKAKGGTVADTAGTEGKVAAPTAKAPAAPASTKGHNKGGAKGMSAYSTAKKAFVALLLGCKSSQVRMWVRKQANHKLPS